MEFLEKLLASEATQQLLFNLLIALGGWIALKVSAIIENQKKQLATAVATAEAQGREVQFAQTKMKFLELLGMGVLSAEQTYKKEVKAKYEDDKNISNEDAQYIWTNVYQDAWKQMSAQDQELLKAFIGDVQSFAKTAIHANLTKLKSLPNNK